MSMKGLYFYTKEVFYIKFARCITHYSRKILKLIFSELYLLTDMLKPIAERIKLQIFVYTTKYANDHSNPFYEYGKLSVDEWNCLLSYFSKEDIAEYFDNELINDMVVNYIFGENSNDKEGLIRFISINKANDSELMCKGQVVGLSIEKDIMDKSWLIFPFMEQFLEDIIKALLDKGVTIFDLEAYGFAKYKNREKYSEYYTNKQRIIYDGYENNHEKINYAKADVIEALNENPYRDEEFLDKLRG